MRVTSRVSTVGTSRRVPRRPRLDGRGRSRPLISLEGWLREGWLREGWLREGWLRGVDLNHRPLGYEPNELPDCSTPRIHHNNRIPERQTARSQIARFDVALVLQFGALAGVNDLRWIDGVFIDLLFHDFAVFADEEIHAARGFVFVEVDAVLVGRFAAPVT